MPQSSQSTSYTSTSEDQGGDNTALVSQVDEYMAAVDKACAATQGQVYICPYHLALLEGNNGVTRDMSPMERYFAGDASQSSALYTRSDGRLSISRECTCSNAVNQGQKQNRGRA